MKLVDYANRAENKKFPHSRAALDISFERK